MTVLEAVTGEVACDVVPLNLLVGIDDVAAVDEVLLIGDGARADLELRPGILARRTTEPSRPHASVTPHAAARVSR